MNPLETILPSFSFLSAIVQDNTLAREFLDALYPHILYRQEAEREFWAAGQGESAIFTRRGLLAPVTTPIVAGHDPVAETPSWEQYSVLAAQYASTLDVNMPAGWAQADKSGFYLQHMRTLGLQAGMSLNRIARNKLFTRYCGGHTVATAEGSSSTSLPVASLNGFTHTLVNGQEVPVGAGAAALAATLTGVGAVSIVAATPASTSQPFGPGTLTLAASATWSAGAAVLAANRPTIIRSGGGSSVDDLSATDALKVADIREAVSIMERDSVPRHRDGYYHMHVDPKAMAQVYADAEFQNLSQGELDSLPHREFVLGKIMGCLVIKNNQAPNVMTSARTGEAGLLASQRAGTTSSARLSPEFWAEMRNDTGVGILRTIITGGGSLVERYIDEVAGYMAEPGVLGTVGAFAVSTENLVVPIEGVRLILRKPLDRLAQLYTQTWSWSGDWGVPGDKLGGVGAARFKRAIVIESGSTD